METPTLREFLASDLSDLKPDFEGIFSRVFIGHSCPGSDENFLVVAPPIETWIDGKDKEFRLSMPIPGMEILKIILQSKQLSFSGEQRLEEDEKAKSYNDGIFPMIESFRCATGWTRIN